MTDSQNERPAPTLRRRLLQIAKWAWIAAILIGVAVYAIRNFREIGAQLATVSPAAFALSVAALIPAKLLLVEITRRSLGANDSEWQPTFAQMLYINSMTQLAKYLPGGVWHFVGRLGFYRANGLSMKRISRGMILDNLWLGVSVAGVALIVLPTADAARALIPFDLPPPLIAAVPILAGIGWLAVLIASARVMGLTLAQSLMFVPTTAIMQAGVWVLAGISLWVIFPASLRAGLLPATIGSFSLSFAAGYVTLFAPGGLGVREAALIALYAGAVTPAAMAVYAAVNRAAWIVCEVLLGLVSEALFGRRGTPAPQEDVHSIPS